ncbi:MAG: RNA degradosome polyphosphate kinase [Pseudomonadota bacterium]
MSDRELAVSEKERPTAAAIMASPGRFINRELSWLAFNERVLEEAANPAHPLLERLRFLSISASNLDEFYMVRYAGLREQVRAGITRPSQDGMTPAEQVAAVEAAAADLMKAQQKRWKTLKTELAGAGIHVLDNSHLTKADHSFLKTYFEQRLFPIVTPLAVDPAHPFPFIPNLGFAVAVSLEGADEGRQLTGLLPLPAFAPRFVKLPSKKPRESRYLPLESLLLLFTDQFFPGYERTGQCVFRVVRDSDIEIEEEAEDLLQEFAILLKQRRRGRIVRIKLEAGAPEDLRELILREIESEPQDLVLTDGILGMSSLSELITDDYPELLFPPFEPRYPERIREMGGDCFAAIRAKDILVHHPYESFDVVVEFVRQAAKDPNVVSIKQTLYRTNANSPIVAALIEAAEAGKNVTALVEIKARFDEEANLRLARDLERAGVQVVYGFIEYKTHAKVAQVVRKEGDALRYYTHYGTGNYHPITARIYTDLSLFTADEALGRDATKLFNFVTAYREPPEIGPDFEEIAMSPITLERDLIEMIEAEAENAREGKPSGIWAKMNSLVDNDVIDALYRASQSGVPITLIIRGICGLRPGVPGLSETILVKSIVGRFLEHARIVCFANGAALPSSKAKVFISSADWMQRNLKRRVESLIPVLTPTVHRQVLNQIMVANINDDAQSWIMKGDGTYARMRPPKAREEAQGGTDGAGPAAAFSAHEHFMENPSLSGRGNAIEVSLPPRLAPKSPTKRRS